MELNFIADLKIEKNVLIFKFSAIFHFSEETIIGNL